MTAPEPLKARKPPPRVGAVGKQLRQLVEQRVRAELGERGWRRGPGKETWISEAGVEPPLQARLSVVVDTMRSQVVRIAGFARVIVPEVEELLARAPEEALSEFERSYRDRSDHALAFADFGAVDGVRRTRPLDWQARDETGVDDALGGFLSHVDGPVRAWFAERSTVPALLGSAGLREPGSRGDAVRAAATLEAVLGDLAAARARLAAYREGPGAGDGVDQVDAFAAWLEQAAPRGAAGS